MDKIDYPLSKGLKAFLIASGIALIVAWFPGIIPTIFSGRLIQFIGVYTTEITYVYEGELDNIFRYPIFSEQRKEISKKPRRIWNCKYYLVIILILK